MQTSVESDKEYSLIMIYPFPIGKSYQVTSTYQKIGGVPDRAVIKLLMTNENDYPVVFSFDGKEDHFFCGSKTTYTLDAFFFQKQIYVKSVQNKTLNKGVYLGFMVRA